MPFPISNSLRPGKRTIVSQIKALEGLNPQQKAAATWNGDHALVLAGAGCGKTKTIIARATHLIENETTPERVYILTFTRRAAQEIVERVNLSLGEKAFGLKASTFHTWCCKLLRRQPRLFGSEGFSVIDADDQLQLFKTARSGSPFAKLSGLPKPSRLRDIYSYTRNTCSSLRETLDGEGVDDKDIRRAAAQIMQEYERKKALRQYLDYDDILEIVAAQMEREPEVLNWIGSQYDEILIDEMQDTNPLQWRLIAPLLSKVRIFCVGDDAQSIYGFRGADFQNVHSFKDRVSNSTVLKLECNYRSTQGILDLANWLLAQSPLRYDKTLVGVRGAGEPPRFISLTNEWEEARWIVDDLLQHRSEGGEWSDNMVLTRSRFAARALQAALLERQIPYVFIGGQKLLESAHVRDVLSVLRVVANPFDEIGWMRYLTLWQGVGDRTASRVVQEILASNEPKQIQTILKKTSKLPKEAASLYGTLVAQTSTNVASSLNKAFSSLCPLLETKYAKLNWEKRRGDFPAVSSLASKHSSILSFLEEYILDPVSTSEVLPNGDDVLKLITVHSAKGTEANRCYVIGCSPGMAPSSRAVGDPDEIEEERRVFYVALTRARDELILTRTYARGFHVEASPGSEEAPPYFFDGIDESLVQYEYPIPEYRNGPYVDPSSIAAKGKPDVGIRLE